MAVISRDIECSVVVCTYRPCWEKLRLTLKSVLMQKNCKYQIVVTDDGSEENLFDDIKKYFSEVSFTEYKLVAGTQNNGTVQNILQGVYASVGRFIKPISPGDFLHGENCLRQWIDFMDNHKDYVMSYCDSIYYHWTGGEIVPVKTKANPQSTEPNAKQYIVYGDFCLGASTMVRRHKWLKYLEMIRGKVIYCEDFSYQIMLFQGMKIINMPSVLLLYEVGTGVSTSNSNIWNERLREDMEAIRKILLLLETGNDKERLLINQYLRIPLGSRWQRLIFCPSKVIFRFKREIFPRESSVELNDDFVHELLTQ